MKRLVVLTALSTLALGCSAQPNAPTLKADGAHVARVTDLYAASDAGNLPTGRTRYEWFPCSGNLYDFTGESSWWPEKPRVGRMLFDFEFAHREAILAAGGQIVHEFHLPVIRARIAISAVAEVRAFAHSVDDPHEFLLEQVLVGFEVPATDDDRAFLEGLGAVVLGQIYPGAGTFFLRTVPDESIPQIEANPRVRFVELNQITCTQ